MSGYIVRAQNGSVDGEWLCAIYVDTFQPGYINHVVGVVIITFCYAPYLYSTSTKINKYTHLHTQSLTLAFATVPSHGMFICVL